MIILLSLYGRFCVDEVAGLKWEDIDFETDIVNVNRTIERLKNNINNSFKTQLMELEPKNWYIQTISSITWFHHELCKVLLQINESKRTILLYLYKFRENIRSYKYTISFSKICNLYDFEINFHSLRHTYATNCIMNDIDIKSLSEILEHSSVSIALDIYVHSSLEFKKAQIQKIKVPNSVAEHEVIW